jgi:hypothetical protein
MPTTTARGYGHKHQLLRAQLKPLVDSGAERCARCGDWIKPGTPWDLGHVDGSGKRAWSGAEHPRCNRATVTRTEWRRRGSPRRITHVTPRATATARALGSRHHTWTGSAKSV